MQVGDPIPPPPYHVSVVPFGTRRPTSKATVVSLLPSVNIPIVPPASDTAFQIDADLLRTARMCDGVWTFEPSRPLCDEETQPDDDAYHALRACARSQEEAASRLASHAGVLAHVPSASMDMERLLCSAHTHVVDEKLEVPFEAYRATQGDHDAVLPLAPPFALSLLDGMF